MERMVQGALHTDAPVVFLQGCSGDITHIDNLSPYGRPNPTEAANRVGGRVGAEAVKTLLGMQAKATECTIAARNKVWKIKRRSPSAETLAKARALVAQGEPKDADNTDYTFAKETIMLEHLIAVAPEVEVEVQAIQIGPAIFLTNPAEYFVESGLDIKTGSPFPFTFPCELSNGCVGYVPTQEAFGPRGGGYETRLTSYSNLEVTAVEQIKQACLALAKSLTHDPAPEQSRLPFDGRPWRYGTAPPGVK